jgi:hypothetical protein
MLVDNAETMSDILCSYNNLSALPLEMIKSESFPCFIIIITIIIIPIKYLLIKITANTIANTGMLTLKPIFKARFLEGFRTGRVGTSYKLRAQMSDLNN